MNKKEKKKKETIYQGGCLLYKIIHQQISHLTKLYRGYRQLRKMRERI
jgi:hypothetical protein